MSFDENPEDDDIHLMCGQAYAEVQKENDKLKAELKTWQDNSWSDSEALMDRDKWQSRAEKAEAMAGRLAEALKELSSFRIQCDFDKAKEVLAAYEQAKGEEK